MPWLPADADQDFDPLEYNDVDLGTDVPMVVTPRGGDQEVGRSCYQVDTAHATYLVDCGLNQGGDESYADFRGLEPEGVGAVFLTHAHIDHCGGLPVLEARGFLDDDAPIIATPPTVDLATLLLEDSLKIHQYETREHERRFTREDVDAVIDRFEPTDYGGGLVSGVADVPDEETLVFRYGNAAHLLGSAWVSLQTNGYRTVFSGDVGGRSKYLPDVERPPQADTLVLESTYGGSHSHASLKGAQTALFEAVETAVRNREPVLIPTFAVGRAQTLQLLFSDRFHTLQRDLQDRVRLVVDGMAQEATEIYHKYVEDETYMDEGMVNRVVESGHETPFRPDAVEFPQTDADRRRILEDANASDSVVPIIVAPSGMLTGGNSPRYLTEFAARYPAARIFLTGYQAKGTTGRVLQNQLDAGADELTFTTNATPIGTDWPPSSTVTWTTVETAHDTDRVTRASIPADWVRTVGGFSAHAAQDGLLSFSRDVDPETIVLIHGPDYSQERLAKHLAENVEGVQTVTRARRLTPVTISRDTNVPTPSLSPEVLERTGGDLRHQVEHNTELITALSEDVAAVRHEGTVSEDDVRRIVRDELADLLEANEIGTSLE